ncbi:unnamed protein product [Trichogramma brassicae]|uniref:Uncharacterized protein n=1 Tax=Trichogramma brassicae TaxID=86971 RepID=A0A6H5J0K7_9HYME|nr:unnamed protein product [Trichogramma brassicae]
MGSKQHASVVLSFCRSVVTRQARERDSATSDTKDVNGEQQWRRRRRHASSGWVSEAYVSPVSREKKLQRGQKHSSASMARSVGMSDQVQQLHRYPAETSQAIELSVPLQTFHYRSGQLNLRCVVKIAGVYEQWSELQLGASPWEPVPERVLFPVSFWHLLCANVKSIDRARTSGEKIGKIFKRKKFNFFILEKYLNALTATTKYKTTQASLSVQNGDQVFTLTSAFEIKRLKGYTCVCRRTSTGITDQFTLGHSKRAGNIFGIDTVSYIDLESHWCRRLAQSVHINDDAQTVERSSAWRWWWRGHIAHCSPRTAAPCTVCSAWHMRAAAAPPERERERRVAPRNISTFVLCRFELVGWPQQYPVLCRISRRLRHGVDDPLRRAAYIQYNVTPAGNKYYRCVSVEASPRDVQCVAFSASLSIRSRPTGVRTFVWNYSMQ